MWLVTQAERKPPSAGGAAGRRLLVSTNSGHVFVADPGRLHVSDTGSETAGGGAAALLLAGFDRLATAGHIEVPVACSPVGLRAFRAEQVRFWRHEEARAVSKAGLCGAHERMLALERLRRPERPGKGARPRGVVKADMSGEGRGASRKTYRRWN